MEGVTQVSLNEKKKKNPAFFSKNMTGTFLLCTGIIHWSEYAVLSTDFFSYALTPEKDMTTIQLNIIRCFLQFIHETLTFYSRIESSHIQEMGGGKKCFQLHLPASTCEASESTLSDYSLHNHRVP